MSKETLIRTLYHSIIFSAGFTTLALEILTSRALAPHVGMTVYVWGALLVISLAMIALGYAWGAYSSRSLAPERKPKAFINRALFAAFFVLLASFFQYSINVFLQIYSPLVASMVGSFVILGPSLFFSASLTPLLIAMELYQKEAKNIQEDKKGDLGDGNAGLILMEATFGSVIGAFACTYLLLPNVMVDTALSIIVIPLLITALITSFVHKRYIPTKIRGFAVFFSVCAVMMLGLNQVSQARDTIRIGTMDVPQVAVSHTPYGTIRVVKVPARDQTPPEYYWLMGGSTQNVMLENGQHRTSYTNAIVNMILNYPSPLEDILVLGGGAGLVARDLSLAQRNVDVVDIVKEAEGLARQYFGLPQDVQYYHEDARVFLNRCDKKYDAIVHDVYGAFSIPDNAFTKEAFEKVSACLKKDGILILNKLRMPKYSKPDAVLNATLKEVFPYIDVYSQQLENAQIVNGLWVASQQSIPPLKLFGGTEPDYVQKELQENWFFTKPPTGGAVSKDALPLMSLVMQPVMDFERKAAFRIYGPFVMQP